MYQIIKTIKFTNTFVTLYKGQDNYIVRWSYKAKTYDNESNTIERKSLKYMFIQDAELKYNWIVTLNMNGVN